MSEDIESRLSKLEQQNSRNIFVQYILPTLIAVLIGAFVTWRVESSRSEVSMQVEKNKADIQRVEVAQKMIPVIFSGNAQQAFATQRLLEMVVDAEVAKEIKEIVAAYYKAKVSVNVKRGDAKSAEQTLLAAKAVGGTAANKILQDRETASRKEYEGFQNLVAGEYDKSLKAFQDAENIFNGYHNVYELARLIRLRKNDFKDPKKRQEIFHLIVTKYRDGIPPDFLPTLKQLAGE